MDNEELAVVAGISAVLNLLVAYECAEEEEQRGKNQRKKRVRSCWQKPWRESRHPEGNFLHLGNEYLMYDDQQSYKSFMIMNEKSFMEILSFIKSDIERKDTFLRKSIPAEEKLALTLRFLTTGSNYSHLADYTKLSESYIGRAVIEVCKSIYKRMGPLFLKFPDSIKEWEQMATEFEDKWDFPLCIGALDGKHVAFIPSKKDSNMYYNYKGFRSIVLLAMADANCCFTCINVGCNGRISDGGVLYRSDLMDILRNPNKYLPEPKIIGDNRKLPYVIVADNAFPCMHNLLTPYNRQHLTRDKETFNYRLSRARQNIERSFGILCKRFQVLQTTIKLNEKKTADIVKCCCVLHNYLMKKDNVYCENEDFYEMYETKNKNALNINLKSNIKNEFKEFFNKEGKI